MSAPRRRIKALVPVEKPNPMEVNFFVEKHRENASYRTNWKAAVAEVAFTKNLEVSVFRIVFENNRAVRVLPRTGNHVPLSDVFSHVDLVE